MGGVWIQRDITSLKEAERFKDQFVSNVSHELRTPLSVISLSCDNLITFYDRLNPTQRGQMLQDIHEQAHLLSSLVEDILQISRINSGRVSERRSRVDLARLVRKEVEKHRIIAERRSQRLTTTTATPVGVLGNEGQLQQVMRNLLDNAIKYTPVGGQIRCVCEIRTGLVAAASDGGSARSGESWAAVEVTDSGIGIAAEDLPFVFERFYRANAETDVTGTGLGLSIAQELVRLHGGWITVASTLGQGSTFTVYLPLVEPGAGDRGRGVGGQ